MADCVLVYLSGALGDVILSSPALALVRVWKPAAHVHWITPRSAHALYPELHDSWTDIHSASVAELFSDGCGEAIARHGVWRRARCAVVFEAEESVLVRSLSRVIEVFAVDARPAGCKGQHYTWFVWEQTRGALGVQGELRVPAPAQQVPQWVPEGEYALVHAGSGSAKKTAPAELMCQVCIEAGAGKNWKWFLVEGEADAAASAAFRARWQGELGTVRTNALRELAWYLGHAAYYVGNDSGVSHLAGVVGARGTVLFGPTDPEVWRPLGNGLRVRRF